jgi:uncharacterized DUF497 family protein
MEYEYEWDLEKNRENQRKHGIGFESLSGFQWGTALIFPSARVDYGESRLQAIGMLDQKLVSLAFTKRGPRIRAISLRTAGRKERRLYNASRQRP